MTTAYEVRVEGELATPTVHGLGCEHCVAEPQTTLRVETTDADLQALLSACIDRGMTIESVVRVVPSAWDPTAGAQQRPSSRPRRTASTRRLT